MPPFSIPFGGLSLLQIWFFSYQNQKDEEMWSFPRNTSSHSIWEKSSLSLLIIQVYHGSLTALHACRPHVTAAFSVYPFCKSQRQLAEDLKAQLLFPVLVRNRIFLPTLSHALMTVVKCNSTPIPSKEEVNCVAFPWYIR